jgi:hypothetical protein
MLSVHIAQLSSVERRGTWVAVHGTMVRGRTIAAVVRVRRDVVVGSDGDREAVDRVLCDDDMAC